MGIFTVIRGGKGAATRFKNNRLSALLREDHPNCLRSSVMTVSGPLLKPNWDSLVWALQTGGKTFEESHGGLSAFEWLKKDPVEEHRFSKAMQENDNLGGCHFPFAASHF